MIQKLIEAFFGSKNEKDLQMLLPLLHRVNGEEAWALSLKDEEFPVWTRNLKDMLAQGRTVDDILPRAFALAREAARRVLGERLYDVQIMGGIVLHQGRIVEMKTGEGKTLSSVPAAYLNALCGRGVHIVTVNDYLAGRDSQWMGQVYSFLGVSVGVILSHMDTAARKAAYAQEITYGTNNEFGFDYLRDNMRYDFEERAQRSHYFCIIDEIDSILIDEARTPLIISGAAEDDTAKFIEMNRAVKLLTECAKDSATGDYPEFPVGDYKIDEKRKHISFTDQGMNHIEEILQTRKIINGSLFLDENFEYIHYMTQALRAHYLFHKDTDYVVQESQVQIVDEFTGRILHGRRYSDGLHQAIEAKENIRVAARNRTLATITFQNFFRLYEKISGMTGTADTEAKEFAKIYNLDVVVIPTNRPVIRADEDDLIFLNEEDKFEAICDEIAAVNKKGQPILVGTVSIEKSEKLDKLLTRRGVRHEVLNAKNHAREALIIAEAGAKGSVTIATNMAGRGTDIKLGGNPEFRARKRAGTDADPQQYREAYDKEYAAWQNQYQEVRRLGGLYILGTERHESRRIDNQLRGRSGRQGDPGMSRFFLSMDDDLMRLFGGRANLKGLLARIGMKPGEPLNHPLLNRTIERAQSKVEERNFDIRKHLLEYDDVLNEQRKFIYKSRDEILTDANLVERLFATVEELIDEALESYIKTRGEDAAVLSDTLTGLKERFLYTPSKPADELKGLAPAALKEIILGDMKKDLQWKSDLFGYEVFNRLIRAEYLRAIDIKWQDHLENLEALREAVSLRSYGQKNPLLEYKLEGFQIFDQLLYDIRAGIAKRMLMIRIQEGGRRAELTARVPVGMASHSQMDAFHSSGGGGGAGQQNVQVQRSVPKVGRNDPCPCGSGKKYKYCHGR
ncbi:MAG: preprotein translocase subunit SecA [Spirochaetales bacterium]|jgi:preprotein translocase subunit SecA|nr:preprotein translocase subunit SecA [Spirochaetales bacterium]